VDTWPELCREIVSAGHEIDITYVHETPADEPGGETKVMQMVLEALARIG